MRVFLLAALAAAASLDPCLDETLAKEFYERENKIKEIRVGLREAREKMRNAKEGIGNSERRELQSIMKKLAWYRDILSDDEERLVESANSEKEKMERAYERELSNQKYELKKGKLNQTAFDAWDAQQKRILENTVTAIGTELEHELEEVKVKAQHALDHANHLQAEAEQKKLKNWAEIDKLEESAKESDKTADKMQAELAADQERRCTTTTTSTLPREHVPLFQEETTTTTSTTNLFPDDEINKKPDWKSLWNRIGDLQDGIMNISMGGEFHPKRRPGELPDPDAPPQEEEESE